MADANQGKEPTNAEELPAYVEQLSAFHKAFAAELRQVVGSIPLPASATVLDVACGDGFYSHCFAARLAGQGLAIGVDRGADGGVASVHPDHGSVVT